MLQELRNDRCNGRVALWGRSMGAATALLTASQLDPLVNGRQKKKILSRPHALLLYSTSLARTHLAANRSTHADC